MKSRLVLLAAWLAAASLAALAGQATAAPASRERPSFVFLITDDLVG